MAAPPSGNFYISVQSLPESAAQTTSGECTPITFNNVAYGGTFDEWTWVPNPGGPINTITGMFRNIGNGGYATAQNGSVVVCTEPEPQGQSLWHLVDNHDGTFLVQLPDTKIIWGLVLTSAQTQLTPNKIFAFSPA
ncbi:hypothetical protein D9756_002894 [Leucocoprinus leucothites]|uniref:Uncharacterized protein n=1 Tax=Leucocoprinus leucothites TaxID=201217 RepID=A0A8H5G799_9AGAR|nr:hypothetical protein D9756_002894 [Leucoagaricus leucothites]